MIERAIATSPTVAARKQQMMEALARDVSAILAEREGGQAQPDEPRSSLIRDVHVGTVFAIIRASIRSWSRRTAVGRFWICSIKRLAL